MGVDQQRAEDAKLARVERSKQIRRDLDAVAAYYVDDVPVAEQARRLGTSRPRVRWMQRVLGLRDGRTKTGWLTTAVGPESSGMEAR